MKLKRSVFYAITVLLALIIAGLSAYLIYNYWYRPRQIEADNARYAAIYTPEKTSEMPVISDATEEAEMPVIHEAAITPRPTPVPTQPVLTAESTVSPTVPAYETVPDDIKLGTPGPDTIMYLAATMPPVQESFHDLISMNPETVGFLTLGEEIALPVVQRPADNSYYLSHDFEGNESDAGCLFVDGVNPCSWV